jgi:hypothetical protein
MPLRVALFLPVLAACAVPPADDISRHIAFIAAESGLPDPGSPRPRVRRTGPGELARQSGDARALDGSSPVGIYLAEANLILVRRDQGEDVLVHELTHWLQYAAGQGPGCAAEAEAYRIQALWRARHALPESRRVDPCDTDGYTDLAREVGAELSRR